MIIVKIDAGLGNQMLEYCFYKQLKDELPQCIIKADMDRWIYKRYVPHNGYELKKVFGIEIGDVATTDEILRCGGEYQRRRATPWDILKKKYYNNIRILSKKDKVVRLSQKDWKAFFDNHRENIDEFDCWIDNSWNWIYEPAIPEFSYVLGLQGKNAEAAGQMLERDSVSLHIRRGDYVGSSHDILTKEYYLRSIEFMCKRLEDPVFWFFSDDPDFIRREYSDLEVPFHIVDWNRESDSHFDMQLMSTCRHNIICNSTFSLWGAILNDDPDKIVIKPDALSNALIPGSGIWYTADSDGSNIKLLHEGSASG